MPLIIRTCDCRRLDSFSSPCVTIQGQSTHESYTLFHTYSSEQNCQAIGAFVCSFYCDFISFIIHVNSFVTYPRVCNHVIAMYSENKLQHYATAYRNHKCAGEKLGLFRFCKSFFMYFFQQIHYSLFRNHFI